MSESVIPNVDMSALLGAPESNPQKASPIETALINISPEDAAATTHEEAKTSFRDLISKEQLADLKRNAPAVATKMVHDANAVSDFGSPVLVKLNNATIQVLEAQRDIKIPDAEALVNDLLRNLDGYAAKYRNKELEGFVEKVGKFFRGAGYSIKSMARDAQPIIRKMEMLEEKARAMEIDLADNVTRGQVLYKISAETLEEVVAVLAALEEIVEVARTEFAVIDAALVEAEKKSGKDGLQTVEYNGKTISINELRTIHTDYANGVSTLDRAWFDWRQQFFLGFAQAPTSRNLVLVSSTIRERIKQFRTMGIPQGRVALASWQQAALAKRGAELGKNLQEGTNRLIQASAAATGEAVATTAMASQLSVISEESVFAIIDSVRVQCEGIVAADRWGRAQRAKELGTMENGEVAIKTAFTESRRALVQNAISGAQADLGAAPAPVPEVDLLAQMGVKA